MSERRSVCPKCHLPIKAGQSSITQQGKTYHRGCAPAPGAAGKKSNPYEKQIGI